MDAAAASWEDQYREQVAPQAIGIIVAAQTLAARESDEYVADVLNDLAFGPRTEPGVLNPTGFAGVSGDGLPIATLLEQSVTRAGQRYNALREQTVGEGVTVRLAPDLDLAQEALDDGQAFIDGVVETILADTARAAELAAMAQRPWVAGWVRQAEASACSRCIVLSGKFYLFNEGFDRHPRCRCSHLPAPDGRTTAGKEALDRLIGAESPEAHFWALTEAEQDRVFGKAGAQAIRDGADISRVVNARRGMSRSQDTNRLKRVRVNGQWVYTTTEATTRRGRRGSQARGVRLMPESILEIAGNDPAERVRLLRLHGYL